MIVSRPRPIFRSRVGFLFYFRPIRISSGIDFAGHTGEGGCCKKYVVLCCLCGGVSAAVGSLFLAVHAVLSAHTASLALFETVPSYIPGIMVRKREEGRGAAGRKRQRSIGAAAKAVSRRKAYLRFDFDDSRNEFSVSIFFFLSFFFTTRSTLCVIARK